jgi:AMIN domain
MRRFSRIIANRLLVAGVCTCLGATCLAQVSVRSVKVLGSKDAVEIEVESSDRIVPETRVLTGPDRLVIDFPNAVPSSQVRNQSVDRGEVKDVRVGLWQAKPPITRLVLDLKTARSFQVFPNGRTVMIKVLGEAPNQDADSASQASGHAGLVAANYTIGRESITLAPRPPLQVSYQDGMLGVYANKVTLSEVLYAIQQRTGADISIPAGAEQERVVTELGPAPAAEVLARLLNGSKFNFLILNSVNDPRQLDRVVLSVRSEINSVPPPAPAANDDASSEDQLVAPPPAPPLPNPSPGPQPPPAGQQQQPPPPQPDENAPDQ